VRLSGRLPLFSFLLEEFGVADFGDLANELSNPSLEEPSLDEHTRFFHTLAALVPSDAQVQLASLIQYDDAIQAYTNRINGMRTRPIQWRYFQYLILLFTERFLDRLFSDRDRLLADLNEHLERFNSRLPDGEREVPAYESPDLRKLAIWSATGSGKTLLMHVNLLQILGKYAEYGRRSELNHVLLLTPNAGLSRQHLAELEESGIKADYFRDGDSGLLDENLIEVIDINKLREEKGETSFPIDAFEDNNLVLVDEGHRGAGGAFWMEARERLCRNGFSFEYSATFGQALSNKPKLEDSYAKWILFDYSYRRFYNDGYGKDFRILNFPSGDATEERRKYLAAAILTFFQQQRYFDDCPDAITRFNLQEPLWAFFGSSVTAKAVRTVDGTKVSDVVDILSTFSEILEERVWTERVFEELLDGGGGLLDGGGNNIFGEAFPYLNEMGMDGEQAFREMAERFFNHTGSGKIRVIRRTGVANELALQVGESAPFGVVNVGDASELFKLCEEQDALATAETTAEESLFDGVNEADSPIHLVVGARKFIEGWSSWRVSSIGLMRVGSGEGPQIIQLFGRGVRLRGLGDSLRRSSQLQPTPSDVPPYLHLLETLTVFGVRADYIAAFRDQLEADGVAPVRTTVEVPVVVPESWPDRLRVIRPNEGADFLGESNVISLVPSDGDQVSPAVVDWYSRLQTIQSDGFLGGAEVEELNEVKVTPSALAFFDLDRAFHDLVAYKSRRGWHCLIITKQQIENLMTRQDWYRLLIPPDLVAIRSIGDVERWNEILRALLRAWCDRRIKDEAARWIQPRLEYAPLTRSDPNIIERHEVSIPADATVDLEQALQRIADEIIGTDQQFVSFGVGELQVLNYAEHLYRPLLYVHEDEDIILKPTSLNIGERTFVNHLHQWCQGDGAEFVSENELFLLRNQTRGRGVGFFEAGNFYPDFIIWLLSDQAQRIAFVDPKGVVRLNGVEDPKIRLRSTIKDLEARLGDPGIRLSSFIISVTPFERVPWWDGDRTTLEEEHHVLFQDSDVSGYVGRLMELVMRDTSEPASVRVSSV
jgi:hypothetical protein